MARLNLIPFGVLCVLGAIAFLGHRGGSFENVDNEAVCSYQAANLDAAPSDVLFVGASRILRGIDPVYVKKRIVFKSGQSLNVERLTLNRPNITQFRPLLAQYIQHRGPPDLVVLQLGYVFLANNLRTWDVPVNNLRNVTFASLSELHDIQSNATLNEYDTILPRKFEANYHSLPALALQKLEINIFSALRWPAKYLKGKDICMGKNLYMQNPTAIYGTVHDGMTFSETPAQMHRRTRNLEIASKFLPLSPAAPFRRFETDQLQQLISSLQAAGSAVALLIMPALGDTDLSQAEKDEIEAVFPGIPLLHPYDLFATELGPDLAKSFHDTHHATPYGGLIYSRHFADAISELKY